MISLPLWMWVAATLGWCGAAMGLSFTIARWRLEGPIVVACVPFVTLPFVLLNALFPWATMRVALIFTFCWVTPCKLLLLCIVDFLLDCRAWTLSHLSHFLLAMLLPVRIKANGGGKRAGMRRHLCLLVVELGALTWFFSWYDVIGAAASHAAHCLALYLVLDLPHRIASIILLLLFGVETHPLFRKPWLSTSLTDFWGRRWNLMANALLRHSVYNPIVNLLCASKDDHVSSAPKSTVAFHHRQQSPAVGAAAAAAPPALSTHLKPHAMARSLLVCLPAEHPPPLYVRLIAVNATFFVSGLIHELIYFALTQGVAPTWQVTTFFMLHGLATSAEITLRRAHPKHVIFKMPWLLKVVLTMGFMQATMARLFFPQLIRAGFFPRCIIEYRAIKKMLSTAIVFSP